MTHVLDNKYVHGFELLLVIVKHSCLKINTLFACVLSCGYESILKERVFDR